MVTPTNDPVFNWEIYNNDKDMYIVMTKHGMAVTQLTLFDARADRYPMRGVCQDSILMFSADGKAAGDSIWDLIMIEK
jgi:hypothetical protein